MRRLRVRGGSDEASFEPRPVSEEVDLDEAVARFAKRAEGIRAWLAEDHSDDLATRAYLDEGTVERAYWHAGYAVAMSDAIRFLTGREWDGSAWS